MVSRSIGRIVVSDPRSASEGTAEASVALSASPPSGTITRSVAPVNSARPRLEDSAISPDGQPAGEQPAVGAPGAEPELATVDQGDLRPVDDRPDQHLQDQVDGPVGVQRPGQPAGHPGEVGRPLGGLLELVLDMGARGGGQEARTRAAGCRRSPCVLPSP